MKLGLITDVHNHCANLQRALLQFREHGVDQIITIGDTCDAFSKGEGADEVVSLLRTYGVIGVWGNHDFTLCRDVSEVAKAKFSPHVLEVMSWMQPRLVIGDCHFSHREASVNPEVGAELWDIGETPPELEERAYLAFDAVEHRLQFVGHYHQWWVATPDGQLNWCGKVPLRFDPSQRYFVVIEAVCNGWCAVLNTKRGELEPLRCGAA